MKRFLSFFRSGAFALLLAAALVSCNKSGSHSDNAFRNRLAGCRSAVDVRFSGTSTSKKAENAVDVRFSGTSTALERVGEEPSLDVPEIAGFSEQTYKFGAFVPVFGLISEQIIIRARPAKPLLLK